jgi:hypothetical protein
VPRWRNRERRRLTPDQRSLLLGGSLFMRRAGEGTDNVIARLFGSWAIARELWLLHAGDLLAADPTPATRPWAWWQWSAPRWEPRHQPTHGLRVMQHTPRRERRVPYDQAAVLGRYKLLTPLEEAQLREWAKSGRAT